MPEIEVTDHLLQVSRTEESIIHFDGLSGGDVGHEGCLRLEERKGAGEDDDDCAAIDTRSETLG
jgi:hypothetical protein